MKVWVLHITHEESDDCFIQGVFATERQASDAAQSVPTFVDVSIDEFEVAPTN